MFGGDPSFVPYLAAFLRWEGFSRLCALRREETWETTDGKSEHKVAFERTPLTSTTFSCDGSKYGGRTQSGSRSWSIRLRPCPTRTLARSASPPTPRSGRCLLGVRNDEASA